MSSSAIGPTTDNVVILVDFDNVYEYSVGADLAWLVHEINKLVGLALGLIPNAGAVFIRFYGGWLENGMLTPLASDLQAVLGASPYFPMKHPIQTSLLRGEITLVTRLLALPSVEWGNTRKMKRGLPRIRLSKDTLPERCINPAVCPVSTLNRFTKHKNKRCPQEGCAVTNSDAFIVVEQKMVDTMIACDVISAVLSRTYSGVVVVSDDADIIPPLALAGSLSRGSRVRLVQTPDKLGSFDSVLSPMGVDSVVYRMG
jgi:hypothetical protein